MKCLLWVQNLTKHANIFNNGKCSLSKRPLKIWDSACIRGTWYLTSFRIWYSQTHGSHNIEIHICSLWVFLVVQYRALQGELKSWKATKKYLIFQFIIGFYIASAYCRFLTKSTILLTSHNITSENVIVTVVHILKWFILCLQNAKMWNINDWMDKTLGD